jgi:hypothetical protein
MTRGVGFPPAYAVEQPQGKPLPWRKLAVEVTAQRVRTYFWADPAGQPQLADEVPAAELEKALLQQNRRPAGVPTDYRPDAGIGLYVLRGEAAFRHIVLEPLPGGG